MVFVLGTRQKELFMVADTKMAKNVAKYALSLLHLQEFGVLVAVTNFVVNHVTKNTRHISGQTLVYHNEDRKRICNRSQIYFQN